MGVGGRVMSRNAFTGLEELFAIMFLLAAVGCAALLAGLVWLILWLVR